MAGKSLVVNAALGALTTIVFGFIPLSPVLGGGLAAYLQEADRKRGLRIGTLSGLIAAMLFVLLAVLFLGTLTAGGPRTAVLSQVFVAAVFVFALLYVVGLSALGGYIGGYLHEGAVGAADEDEAEDEWF